MGKEFNKTEADFAYERYNKMGGISPEQDTIIEQLPGDLTDEAGNRPLESALASRTPLGETPLSMDGTADSGSDPDLAGDPILAADIGLNAPEEGLGRRADRNGGIAASPAPERDELLESDAIFTAGAAGLTGGVIDYAEEDELLDEEEEQALEDVPDADELQPGTAVDPAAPPVDVMPGTDLLNGSTGEEDR